MDYILMRKNDPITYMNFSDTGKLNFISKKIKNADLLPICDTFNPNCLYKWWERRAVPIEQGRISEFLHRNNLIDPDIYLVKNLGLSLTDYYWIKPFGSDITWEDVNLYENDFKENLLLINQSTEGEIPQYTPNSSLQGTLEKTWSIDDTGERILIKGNRNYLSCESINEVIASELHKKQGYTNYTNYNLLHIKDKDYDYGCFSKAFTNLDMELVSGYDIVNSEKKRNDISMYEHFISVSQKHGIDADELRKALEYQIMTDFILSGHDRHFSNFAVLRDSQSLKFLKMAPIFDSGKCLFVDSMLPRTEKDLLSIKTQSFASTELKLLNYVTDRALIDINKLPSPAYIEKMYSLDSKMDEHQIKGIVKWYEAKVDKFDDFQHGKSLSKYSVSI